MISPVIAKKDSVYGINEQPVQQLFLVLGDRGDEVGKRRADRLSPVAVTEGLTHPDVWVRDHCQAILKLQGKRAYNALTATFRDEDAEVRWRVLEILAAHAPQDRRRSDEQDVHGKILGVWRVTGMGGKRPAGGPTESEEPET